MSEQAQRAAAYWRWVEALEERQQNPGWELEVPELVRSWTDPRAEVAAAAFGGTPEATPPERPAPRRQSKGQKLGAGGSGGRHRTGSAFMPALILPAAVAAVAIGFLVLLYIAPVGARTPLALCAGLALLTALVLLVGGTPTPGRSAVLEGEELPPDQRAEVAVLVVHGIGQQDRYATLNALVSGMDGLPDDGPVSLGFEGERPSLVTVPPQGAASISDVTGVQALVHFAPSPDRALRASCPVDFYEAYWSPLAQRKQTLRTVLHWLMMTALALALRLDEPERRRRGRSLSEPERQLLRRKAWFDGLWLVGVALLATVIVGLGVNALMLSTRTVAIAAQAEAARTDGPPNRRVAGFAPLAQAGDIGDVPPQIFPKSAAANLDAKLVEPPGRFPVITVWLTELQPTIYMKQIAMMAKLMPWWAWLYAVAGVGAIAMALRAYLFYLRVNQRIEEWRASRSKAEHRREWFGIPELQSGRRRQLLLFVIWLSLFALLMLAVLSIMAETVLFRAVFAFTLFWLGLYGLKLLLSDFVINFLGDIPTYTVTSENSETYEARQAIKAKVSAVLESLLQEPRYRRVIVVGHSLGSVIARDVLLGLHRRMEVAAGPEREEQQRHLEKVKAFVTMGSPLRKVQNFLEVRRESSPVLEALRESHDAHLFARYPAIPATRGPRWFNYWIMSDLVANPFRDRFPVYEEQRIPARSRSPWTHSDYWVNHSFLERLGLIIWNLPANREQIWPDGYGQAAD